MKNPLQYRDSETTFCKISLLGPAMFFQQIRTRKDYQGYLLSFVLGVCLIIHLLTSDVVVADKAHDLTKKEPQAVLLKPSQVQVKVVEQEYIAKELQLYGRTEPNKKMIIKAERAAKVVQLNVQQGQPIKAATVLMRLDEDNLQSRLDHAQALIKQRQLEYDSALHLQEKGHQAKLIVAQKSTQLAQAHADLALLKKHKKNTLITSPISGMLNTTFAEIGDFVQVGDTVAEVLELDPLIVKINVPETVITELAVGQIADVSFLDGSHYQAKVAYIASSSNIGTNTFTVELNLPNPDYKIPAGISATVLLKTQRLAASAISPAYLSLNEQGQSGIYVVENGVAVFKKANILKSTAQQLWVNSLGEKAQVIVVGHQGILDGYPVEMIAEKTSKTLTF